MPSFETVENLLAPLGGVGDALLYLGLLLVAGFGLVEWLARRRARRGTGAEDQA